MAVIKWLASPADYLSVWRDMQDYTNLRGADTTDEIWLCEHAPVYTLGQAGSPEHVLNPDGIPIVHCDRGGQVTYHGPGQVMAYALFDLRRVDMYVKEYVTLLEGAVIDTLAGAGVAGACRKPGAPGVYAGSRRRRRAGQDRRAGHQDPQRPRLSRGVAERGHGPDALPGHQSCGYAGLRTVDMAARRAPRAGGRARRWRAIWLPPGAAHGPRRSAANRL